MFIRKTVKRYKGQTYINCLLVETESTPRGPRQRTICSLGDLSPGPRSKWLGLVGRIEAALQGQMPLDSPEPLVDAIVGRIRSAEEDQLSRGNEIVAVHTDQVSLEKAREAGPVHVGHQMWRRLGLGEILQENGLSARARLLSEVMVLNRLVAPCSEHAMPAWIENTALSDILSVDLSELSDTALYRNLDRLHPNRQAIEAALAQREKSLFNLDDTYCLYDLTSTYFEGQCLKNPKAQRGYSRDHRPDCKQVVVGLVLDRDGFPKAHEVFAGNRQDRTSLDEMLRLLEKRSALRDRLMGGFPLLKERVALLPEFLGDDRRAGEPDPLGLGLQDSFPFDELRVVRAAEALRGRVREELLRQVTKSSCGRNRLAARVGRLVPSVLMGPGSRTGGEGRLGRNTRMDQSPVAIGTRTYWVSPEEKLVLLAPEDRAQHLYIVGKTGLGKSTLLRNLILQDLYAGRGVGLLDPHGDLARDVLNAIPRGRTNDVLYFNSGDLSRPVGLNLLPKVARDEEHLVVAGVLSAFRGIWGSSWGPRLEYILGHALSALMGHGNLTILALPRLLSDDMFRERLTAKVRDPIVRAFWRDEYARYEKRFRLEAIAPIQNKVGRLLASAPMRNVFRPGREPL